MKNAARFFLLCGLLVAVTAQWNTQWSWGEPPKEQNRPQPGGRPRPDGRPRPEGRPQPPQGPAPDPAPAPNPAPSQMDRNGQLIGCPCVTTHENNLVCGSDGNTYGNMGKLRCAQRCVAGLQMLHLGTCSAPPPAPLIPSQ